LAGDISFSTFLFDYYTMGLASETRWLRDSPANRRNPTRAAQVITWATTNGCITPELHSVLNVAEPDRSTSLWNKWSHNLQVAVKAVESDLKSKLSTAEDAVRDPNSTSVVRSKASTLVSFDGRISKLKTALSKLNAGKVNNLFGVN
jgi:hypothetical protein